MNNPLDRRSAFAFIALSAAMLLAACAAGAATPSPNPTPTARPTPTPIAAPVRTPQDAAALVIATDPQFAGTMPLTPDVIGASRWWTSRPLPGGGYEIELTIGWGDCPAGCTNRHVWTFRVAPDGKVQLVSETGDPVPADLPA